MFVKYVRVHARSPYLYTSIFRRALFGGLGLLLDKLERSTFVSMLWLLSCAAVTTIMTLAFQLYLTLALLFTSKPEVLNRATDRLLFPSRHLNSKQMGLDIMFGQPQRVLAEKAEILIIKQKLFPFLCIEREVRPARHVGPLLQQCCCRCLPDCLCRLSFVLMMSLCAF